MAPFFFGVNMVIRYWVLIFVTLFIHPAFAADVVSAKLVYRTDPFYNLPSTKIYKFSSNLSDFCTPNSSGFCSTPTGLYSYLDGPYYCKSVTPGSDSAIDSLCQFRYSCPPLNSPDYTVLSDINGNPDSNGKFCSKNNCGSYKDSTVSPYVDVASLPSTICYQGCKAVNTGPVDTSGTFYWVQEHTYKFDGSACPGNTGWIDQANGQNSNTAQDHSAQADKDNQTAQADSSKAQADSSSANASADAAKAAAAAAQAAADAAKAAATAAAQKAQAAITNVNVVNNNPASTDSDKAAALAAASSAAQEAAAASAKADAAVAQAQAAVQAATAAGNASAAALAAAQSALAQAQATASQAQAAAAAALAAYNQAVTAADKSSSDVAASADSAANAANAAAVAAKAAAAAAAQAAAQAAAAANAANSAAGGGGGSGSGGGSGGGGGSGSGGSSGGGSGDNNTDDPKDDPYGDFNHSGGDKTDPLAKVFSAESRAALVDKQVEMQSKIDDVTNNIKGLFSFSSVSMGGDLPSDVHKIKGADVDLSGIKVFEGMSGIKGVLWLLAVIAGVAVILTPGGKN